MPHVMFDASAGRERWKQCKVCGATKHSGYWWLAGWRSKVEPPCYPYANNISKSEWAANAESIHGKINEKMESEYV